MYLKFTCVAHLYTFKALMILHILMIYLLSVLLLPISVSSTKEAFLMGRSKAYILK